MKNTKLKAKRKSCGFTQVELASKTNISEVSYQRVERGVQEPGATTAILIAEVLGIQTFEEFKALFGVATPAIEKEPGGNRADPTSKG